MLQVLSVGAPGAATYRRRKGQPVVPEKMVALINPGAHAAAVRDLIPALRGRGARRGAITDGKDSFPLTDGGDLPASRMFFAALTSRS